MSRSKRYIPREPYRKNWDMVHTPKKQKKKNRRPSTKDILIEMEEDQEFYKEGLEEEVSDNLPN